MHKYPPQRMCCQVNCSSDNCFGTQWDDTIWYPNFSWTISSTTNLNKVLLPYHKIFTIYHLNQSFNACKFSNNRRHHDLESSYVRSPKLSSNESVQFWNGWPFSNNRYCKHPKIYVPETKQSLINNKSNNKRQHCTNQSIDSKW